MSIGVLVFGLVLISVGSLGQTVKVLMSPSDPTVKYWARIMLLSTIVMNVSIVLHLYALQYDLGAIGNTLLFVVILVSPLAMLYATRMMDQAEKALPHPTKSKSEA